MTTITNITGKYEQTMLSETVEKQRTEMSTAQPMEESKPERIPDDRVSLSKESRDMQVAKNAVAATPDTRQEKVNDIKQAIADGRYEVDAGKIAEKMIGSIINEVF
jgi:flagellar biosynthesis anti-sigma factor FlgM